MNACGRSNSAAQHAKWATEFTNSNKQRIGLQEFRDLVAFKEAPVYVQKMELRAPTSVPRSYTTQIQTQQRTFIGQPPSVDQNLLIEYSQTQGGHSIDNGGFRTAMNELENLENQED